MAPRMRLRRVKHLREQNNQILKNLQEEIAVAKAEVKNLTDILIEANIIEDIDMSDVKYRQVIDYSSFYPIKRNVPYIVNEVKVKL
jgi:hypothetical protein